jgi:hypothetical protein
MTRHFPLPALAFLILVTRAFNCAALQLPISNEDLILGSRDIIHGIAKEVKSQRGDGGMIYTYTKILVLDVYKGEAPKELIIRNDGGTVDSLFLWVEDEPEFKEGTEVIVHTYLTENGDLVAYCGERGVYLVKDGFVERANMTIDQYKNFVAEVIKQSEADSVNANH